MSRQLLFYENVTPVSSQRHRDWSIDGTAQRYQFSSGVNSVPLTAIELPAAAREYTIVFAGADEAIIPVVILGIEGNENLYVDDEGAWDARYIPAFVRRYPFVFASSEDEKTFTLCLDEKWAGCNQEGKGERLFDDAGERTEYLSNVLNFLQDYQNHFRRTQTFCAKLRELGLLEPMQAQFTLSGGEQRQLTGFQSVSRDKLKALSGKKLGDLAKTDELELCFIQLQSMSNFSQMLQRRAGKDGGAGTD